MKKETFQPPTTSNHTVNKTETLGFPLRFDNLKQKKKIAKIAKKNKRSLNAEILHMVDLKILADSSQGTSSIKK